MTGRTIGILTLLSGLCGGSAEATSPSPGASPSIMVATATPAPVATPTGGAASATRAAPTATARAAAGHDREDVDQPAAAAPEAAGPGSAPGMPPVPTVALAQPRAYRTPERAGPPAFAAPQGATGAPAPALDGGGAVGRPPVMAGRPAARTGSAAVVFRVSARTVVEGFDLRIGYPRTVGSFGSASRPAECNAGSGMAVAANDRGDGEMRLLVASAQALPFPIDVFCRFTTEPGAGVGATDFAVRVAEVTSDGKRADPGLLLVSVVVR